MAEELVNQKMVELFGNWDYKREYPKMLPKEILRKISQLSSELLEVVKKQKIFHLGNILRNRKIIDIDEWKLRSYLILKGFDYNDKLPVLYIHDYAREIYFNPKDGKRIGDELGIYHWFLKE